METNYGASVTLHDSMPIDFINSQKHFVREKVVRELADLLSGDDKPIFAVSLLENEFRNSFNTTVYQCRLRVEKAQTHKLVFAEAPNLSNYAWSDLSTTACQEIYKRIKNNFKRIFKRL